MKVKNYKKGFLTALMILLSIFSFAQNVPEPESPTGNPPPPGLVVPIDMGIPWLIFAGLVLGIYFRNNTKGN